MNNRSYSFGLLLVCLCFLQRAYTQDASSPIDTIITLPDKLFASINKKTTAIEGKLDKQTHKYLNKLQKQEQRLKAKLLRKDSVLAGELFQDINDQYHALQSIPQNIDRHAYVYSGRLDSLSTALNFLKNMPVAAFSKSQEVEKTLQHLGQLQGRLNQTDRISKYLQERRHLLKENLQRLGMVKGLKKYQKQVSFYQAQVQEYKRMFEEPGKLEVRLLEIAMMIPQFKEFFSRNSMLGSLFSLPGSSGNATASLQGLQTRDLLSAQIAERFGSGTEVTQMLQQNIQGAQIRLSELKDKASQYGSGSFGSEEGDMEMANYRAKATQKVKSFWKRLEVGGNVQSQKARSYYPATSDIAATLGYRANDNWTWGLGFSFKLGLGQGWNAIKLSHQGLSGRFYTDLRLKGSFFVSAGYEQNYRSAFKSVEQLRQYSAWSASGLVGLTKKYTISRKVKGNMQLLWDFLSYRQVIKTTPLLWRIGYNFK